jgi:hypothetical protein
VAKSGLPRTPAVFVQRAKIEWDGEAGSRSFDDQDSMAGEIAATLSNFSTRRVLLLLLIVDQVFASVRAQYVLVKIRAQVLPEIRRCESQLLNRSCRNRNAHA